MTDERKRPPPRPSYPRPVEPFKNLTEPSHVEVGAATKDIVTRLDEVLASHREILGTQRRHSLEIDAFGQVINRRFDVFHEELAMLRSTVMESHGPRIEKVEASLGQKAAKGGGIAALVVLAGPMLIEALPKYRAVIEAVAGLFQ